jgi:hypothetical protein
MSLPSDGVGLVLSCSSVVPLLARLIRRRPSGPGECYSRGPTPVPAVTRTGRQAASRRAARRCHRLDDDDDYAPPPEIDPDPSRLLSRPPRHVCHGRQGPVERPRQAQLAGRREPSRSGRASRPATLPPRLARARPRGQPSLNTTADLQRRHLSGSLCSAGELEPVLRLPDREATADATRAGRASRPAAAAPACPALAAAGSAADPPARLSPDEPLSSELQLAGRSSAVPLGGRLSCPGALGSQRDSARPAAAASSRPADGSTVPRLPTDA